MAHFLRQFYDPLLRPSYRAFCNLAPSISQSTPLPVVPQRLSRSSPWDTVTPGRVPFPKDVDKYTTMDFLKCFDGFDAYHDKISRRCKNYKEFLMVRVKVLKKLKIPREHIKLIMKYTHRYRMGIWKPKLPETPGAQV